MSADAERYPPPNDPVAFESLCLDLFREIWKDPSAQKNGRSGQPQAGVDVFGNESGRQMGVQCKQKDGLLRSRLTIRELEEEAREARKFKPPLQSFIVATTGPRDAKVQERARELSAENAAEGLFSVKVWSWEDLWHLLYARKELLQHALETYWPRTAKRRGHSGVSALRNKLALVAATLTLVGLAYFGVLHFQVEQDSPTTPLDQAPDAGNSRERELYAEGFAAAMRAQAQFAETIERQAAELEQLRRESRQPQPDALKQQALEDRIKKLEEKLAFQSADLSSKLDETRGSIPLARATLEAGLRDVDKIAGGLNRLRQHAVSANQDSIKQLEVTANLLKQDLVLAQDYAVSGDWEPLKQLLFSGISGEFRAGSAKELGGATLYESNNRDEFLERAKSEAAAGRVRRVERGTFGEFRCIGAPTDCGGVEVSAREPGRPRVRLEWHLGPADRLADERFAALARRVNSVGLSGLGQSICGVYEILQRDWKLHNPTRARWPDSPRLLVQDRGEHATPWRG